MPVESVEKRHSIRLVARRSGLTPDVLRVWEKRYGVVEPGRSSGGHRRYSDADIARLRLVKAAVDAGARIGTVASMPSERLEELVAGDRSPTPPGGEAEAETFLADALAAARALDATRLRMVMARAVVTLAPERFLDEVAVTFLHRIGQEWVDGKLTPGHEHLASQVVRQTATDMLDALQPNGDPPKVVLAAPVGERHHLAALLAAVSAALVGWRVVYLGGDLPAVDIGTVATATDADAVALSITVPAPTTDTEVQELRRVLGPEVPIALGGQAAPGMNGTLQEVAADYVKDLAALRRWLRSLRNPPGGRDVHRR